MPISKRSALSDTEQGIRSLDAGAGKARDIEEVMPGRAPVGDARVGVANKSSWPVLVTSQLSASFLL